MKRKLQTTDLFSQPISNEDQEPYTKGWNDAVRHIAEVFDRFPFPLYGKDILCLLKPDDTEREEVRQS